MRRYLTLLLLLCLAVPAGITFSGCSRDPGANTCNGLGYGLRVTDVATITLSPRTTGISLAFGQTQQASTPVALTCKSVNAEVKSFSWGTTNNQLVDISPTGNICAGRWNRNSGGGIADYTICNFPNPLPKTGGLPYAAAYITATASSVVSNPVEVYVHPQVTSVTLVGPTTCQSQGTVAQLDSQACYNTSVNGTPTPVLLCAPSNVTTAAQRACPLPGNVTAVPNCSTALGPPLYFVGTQSVASINQVTNQITALQPGTTAITESTALSGSSAGYFSTCPPASISLTLANGGTTGTVNHNNTQNLVTDVVDTTGATITGLTLDYQSTDPIDISVSNTGAVSPTYPGTASITAICQPSTCNPTPINQVGQFGTGLSISSNPVTLTYQGANSNYIWLGAPGTSQYVIPVQLQTGSVGGTVGSTVRLPYVPNTMMMDKLGTNIYLGSPHELMIYTTASNAVTKEDASVPGTVLAVAPNNSEILINDAVLGKFYIYSSASGILSTYAGRGTAASWTPDSKTLYVSDSAAANSLPANIAAGTTGHTDTLYVFNSNTGWTQYPLPCSTCATPSRGGQSLAVTVPSVGAYVSGSPTVAHTWCPSGPVADYNGLTFYPLGDQVLDASSNPVETDVLAATTDGHHILGASLIGGIVELSDIGVTIPTGECPTSVVGTPPVNMLDPLLISHTLSQTQLTQLNGAAISEVNQVIAAPVSNLAFLTYTASATNYGALLPYYAPPTGNTGALGTVGYITLSGSSASSGPTAPVAGAFSPDDSLFFVSTAGDNLVHYISVPTLTDTQQISPGLPACTPPSAGGRDAGCTYTGTDSTVPATVITVKPRTTT